MNKPSESSLLCNRRCAKPLARFDLLTCSYTPTRSAVNCAKLGQWEKYCPEMLNPKTKCHRAYCKDFVSCFLPSRYEEGEKGIT